MYVIRHANLEQASSKYSSSWICRLPKYYCYKFCDDKRGCWTIQSECDLPGFEWLQQCDWSVAWAHSNKLLQLVSSVPQAMHQDNRYIHTSGTWLVQSKLDSIKSLKSVSDVGLKYVSLHCLHLQELSVSDCPQVTDFGLFELAKLGPVLRYMSLAKCSLITDSGLCQLLKMCYKLRYLNIRGCEAISDTSLAVLALSCDRMRSLDIGKCDVTDEGVQSLARSGVRLRKLSLKSCEMVTDVGIMAIAAGCPNLVQLNIQDCNQITVDAYVSIKKACKRCIIEHTNPGFG